jgi:hypothetical protein
MSLDRIKDGYRTAPAWQFPSKPRKSCGSGEIS